jgi:hypothetical protein
LKPTPSSTLLRGKRQALLLRAHSFVRGGRYYYSPLLERFFFCDNCAADNRLNIPEQSRAENQQHYSSSPGVQVHTHTSDDKVKLVPNTSGDTDTPGSTDEIVHQQHGTTG